MSAAHNPEDPLCKCDSCRKLRANAIAKIDADAIKRRKQEVLIESAVQSSRKKLSK